ncbi:MAG: EamA family transporter [Anaerolineaceae bacterium]|nr:EamA family transporter [Anaerolineaceae bacterium]
MIPPVEIVDNVADIPVQSMGFMTRIPPWSLVVFGIISVQIGAAFAKSLFDVSGPAGVVFIRTFLAAVFFTLIWRPRLRGYTRRVYVSMLIYGTVIACNMLLFYTAINLIPLGVAVAIAFIGPLVVAVVGSRKLMDFVWVAVAAIGILLLSPLTNTSLNVPGVMVAFMTAGAWALYIIFTKRVSTMLEGHTTLALSMCLAALVAFPFGAAGAVKVLANPQLILLVLVVALLSSVIPFAMDFTAVKRLTSRVFGLLASVEPAVSAIIGFVVLHEALGWREVIGIGLVTVAAIATTREG